jgi:hypothetical protein
MRTDLLMSACVVVWTAATVAGIVAASMSPAIRGELAGYVRFLLVPWKLAVFVPAAIFVTFAGSFAYDDTWDVVAGGGMSLLTYLTAPWAVGVFYRCGRGWRPRWHELLALVACLFSASWFYDGWLLIRDGSYPETWLPNLGISPALYLLGGALWNLELDATGRPTFGFLRQEWPAPPTVPQARPMLFLMSLPPILLAAVVLIFSVKWRL